MVMVMVRPLSMGRLRRAFTMAATMKVFVGADDGDVGRCVGAEVGSVMEERGRHRHLSADKLPVFSQWLLP